MDENPETPICTFEEPLLGIGHNTVAQPPQHEEPYINLGSTRRLPRPDRTNSTSESALQAQFIADLKTIKDALQKGIDLEPEFRSLTENELRKGKEIADLIKKLLDVKIIATLWTSISTLHTKKSSKTIGKDHRTDAVGQFLFNIYNHTKISDFEGPLFVQISNIRKQAMKDAINALNVL
jgi:hypothetical protein